MNKTLVAITSSFNLTNRANRQLCKWKTIELAGTFQKALQNINYLHSLVVNVL